jgi:hypothetical protein
MERLSNLGGLSSQEKAKIRTLILKGVIKVDTFGHFDDVMLSQSLKDAIQEGILIFFYRYCHLL